MSNSAVVSQPTFRVPRFCPRCGEQMVRSNEEFTRWVCAGGHKTYCNPVPVGVGIIPTIDGGYVLIRRAIEPALGMMAFPGGNICSNESAAEAISREVAEETGLQTATNLWRPHSFVSTPNNQKILLFAVYQEPVEPDLDWATPDGEASEVVIAYHVPSDMAFPLHADVLRNLFLE